MFFSALLIFSRHAYDKVDVSGMKIQFLPRPWIMAALSLFWLGMMAFGFEQFWRYSRTPGAAAAAPGRWPENRVLSPDYRHLSLVMVIHPKCPCSCAGLAELAQLMAHSRGRLRATVVFVQYKGVSASWVQSDTWRQASAIPGVSVITDQNGALARLFEAQTSGQTYLYGPQGRLLFSGGLTAERGQEGDNAGLRAAFTLLRGQRPEQARTPVFGCPLFSPQTTQEGKPSCRL